MAARITLTVGGKDHMFGSLREATHAVREKQVTVQATEKVHLDAVIEFGEWLIALKETLKADVGHGNWIGHLQASGIHVKRAQRAMRLAEWHREGRPNRSVDSKNDARVVFEKQQISLREAERRAGRRSPAPLEMLGWGADGDDEEGDMEGHEMDGENAVETSADEREWSEEDEARPVPAKTAVRPATGPQLTLASVYSERIAPHINAIIDELDDAPSGVSVDLIAEWRALRDKTARVMRGGR